MLEAPYICSERRSMRRILKCLYDRFLIYKNNRNKREEEAKKKYAEFEKLKKLQKKKEELDRLRLQKSE